MTNKVVNIKGHISSFNIHSFPKVPRFLKCLLAPHHDLDLGSTFLKKVDS